MQPWGLWLQSRAPDPASTPVLSGAARRPTVNAKSKKTASKKPVPAKKAAKTAATPKAVAKKVVTKPVAVKASAKAAKPVAKKAAPAKVAAKKVVAKKAAPAKKAAAPKAVPKKTVAKKAVPVKKAVAKKVPTKAVKTPVKPAKAPVKVAAKKGVVKPIAKVATKPTTKAVAKPATKVVAKPMPKVAAKPIAKAAPAKKAPAAKPTPAKVTKPVVAKVAVVKPTKPAKEPKAKPVAAAPAPVVHVTPIIPGYTPVVHKKNSRAAKMAALVPPPPAQVVASNAAKNSFMPMTAPSAPTIVPVIPKKDAKLADNWKTKTADQLTDAEIIAMPDSEYMNDTQMAFFRLKLVQLKNEVLSNASETTEHLREDTVVVPDPADRATIEEEHALELRTRDRERKLLKKIEQSIQRIDSGDYGYCDETGEAIGVGRLLARPTASLSLEAQERREIKQRMFGD